MKNILVLTPVYPAKDLPKTDTPIVHYFTREWIKMSYNVRVVHYVANFPTILYMLARPFKDLIGAKVGFGIRITPSEDCEYELDGVQVRRICIRKTRPHVPHSKKDMQVAIQKTIAYCNNNRFIPDVVIGHWPNPQLSVLSELKKVFHCRTCFVSHGDFITCIYKDKAFDLLREIDLFGFRCNRVKENFFAEFDLNSPYFMCYSGIPATFLDELMLKDFSVIKDFIYVGTLIKRKYPSIIPMALSKAFGKDDFFMRFIGTGAESNSIESVAKKEGISDRVRLMGRMERSEVRRLMNESQVFVMISRNEAYGLVYLEAMACGCITIASRDEGFDGIIRHGENGFLCEAGNAHELTELIKAIRCMPPQDLQRISLNARKTAESLTDVKAAKHYLDALESVCMNRD